jgi:hypothetical protein
LFKLGFNVALHCCAMSSFWNLRCTAAREQLLQDLPNDRTATS